MSDREQFFRLVRKREPVVLSWFMAFFNLATAKRLLGEDCVPLDCAPAREWLHGASSDDNIRRKINFAQATGNFSIGVGRNGSFAFGHGGPGEFCEKLIEEGGNHRVTLYETGVKSHTQNAPHFYHNYDHPVAHSEDLDRLVLPDPDDPTRYAGIAQEAQRLRDSGFVVHASLNGFFSGVHYFLLPYDRLLEGMLLEPEFIAALTDRLGEYNLRAAENLLRCGVDMITFCDDLGSGNALIMSPALYRRFFLPWHRKLAQLCHRHGAVVHMHSHGNINAVVPNLVDAGIDLLNPLDPTEHMDLPALKGQYGGRMTFAGGIDRFFYEWEPRRQREYLLDLVQRANGGFVLMDSGGVPETVTPDQFVRVKEMFDEIKAKWA